MTTQTPAGWYPDPFGHPQLRWWDGGQWTDATHPLEGVTPQAQPAATTAPTPPAPQQPEPAPPTGAPAGPPTGPQQTAASPGFTSPGLNTAERPQQQPGQFGAAGAPTWPSTSGWTGGPQSGGTAQMPVPDFGPPGTGYPGGPPPRKSGALPWVLGGVGAVVVVAAIIIAVVFVVNRSDTSPVAQATPTPPSTGRPETLPSLPPTPFPSDSTAPNPNQSAPPLPQPQDGRITDPVTHLSYEVPEGWEVPASSLNSNPNEQQWTSGVMALSHEKFDGQSDWVGNVYTGELHELFPYSGPESLRGTATTIFHYYNKRFYEPEHEQKILRDEAIKIGDQDAWVLEFELDFTKESEKKGYKWKKERGAIVLMDRPGGLRPALMYISVPDNLDTSNVERVLKSLKVS
ncbi:hypothetical protein HNP84_006290 [Thermocatellispora tengchongensis]|uniref:DUF2510 domain-containing protein n=1 Tax=Thermocatellispora tengchongensis TaxID=1073253 RepID=A0A840PF28_9ACTN|nr:DUF2510 domain-containing protein [Thermocatellispora tengchongensis]MBB5136543.1 hypothetical protein [Thermocatellispora tengchongensis]